MKKSYLYLMLFIIVIGFTTKTTKAATQADSIAVTLWCGINDSLYNASAGGVWVTGDFTAPIKHGTSDFWWHMPLDSVGKLRGDTIWYKITFHYKPGSLVDSSASTQGNSEMAHDSAFWYFSLAGSWDLGETVGAPCNIAWGVNRAIKFGTTDMSLAYFWGECPALDNGNPSVYTGINQVSNKNELSFFPNPADNIINLKNAAQVSNIKIVDITGQIVKQLKVNGQSSIDICTISNGIYLIQIEGTNGKTINSKLIKR